MFFNFPDFSILKILEIFPKCRCQLKTTGVLLLRFSRWMIAKSLERLHRTSCQQRKLGQSFMETQFETGMGILDASAQLFLKQVSQMAVEHGGDFLDQVDLIIKYLKSNA